jgi:prepilin-type N-terminal cleavage/methylation domain-containing protein
MTNERGMTLVEVLVAVVIITIGLTAVATGMQLATGGITAGQQETTALFLAEQRLEDIKAFALSTAAAQGFTNVTSANFPVESYGGIANYTAYRRTVTITDPSATMKRVTVDVFYFPVAVASSNTERQVSVSTAVRQR